MLVRAVALFLLPAICCAQGVISTIAGTGVAPTTGTNGDGGLAINATLHPNGMAMDSIGTIYVADQSRQNVRKISTSGIISTVAGTGNTIFKGDGGLATDANIQLSSNHSGLAVDKDNNLYIADYGSHRIRKIDANGIIRTVAGNGTQGFGGDGGPATSASLWHPSGVAFDAAGNMYIADTDNARIRKVTSDGVITTFAGNGAFASGGDGLPAPQASLFNPTSVAVDALGNVYIAEFNAYKIRKVNTLGIISTVAGSGVFGYTASLDNGPAIAADMSAPWAVWPDNFGNLLIADHNNNKLRKVDAAGIITTIAGNLSNNPGDGGPPTSSRVTPADVLTDAAGNIYIADSANRIRKITIGQHVPGLSTDAGSLYFSIGVGASPPSAQVVPISTAGTVPIGYNVSVSTDTGGTWLQATIPGTSTPSILTVSVKGGLSAGMYTGRVHLTPIAPDLPVLDIPVTYAVVATAAARPAVAVSNITNAANFEAGMAANTWITIKGTNLASATATWDNAIINGQLPTSLEGVTVTFSGRPGFISYVSPSQINVLTPQFGSSASVVVTANGSSSSPVNPLFKTALPGFFMWPGNQVVATRTDYSLAVKAGTFPGADTIAAKPGDTIILWGTGFGPSNPLAPTGVPVPVQTYSAANTPTITINNINATVYGAALAPGLAGLYQVAIQVPTSLPDGDWPVAVAGFPVTTTAVLSVKR